MLLDRGVQLAAALWIMRRKLIVLTALVRRFAQALNFGRSSSGKPRSSQNRPHRTLRRQSPHKASAIARNCLAAVC
jgi:hypothetical protein